MADPRPTRTSHPGPAATVAPSTRFKVISRNSVRSRVARWPSLAGAGAFHPHAAAAAELFDLGLLTRLVLIEADRLAEADLEGFGFQVPLRGLGRDHVLEHGRLAVKFMPSCQRT